MRDEKKDTKIRGCEILWCQVFMYYRKERRQVRVKKARFQSCSDSDRVNKSREKRKVKKRKKRMKRIRKKTEG